MPTSSYLREQDCALLVCMCALYAADDAFSWHHRQGRSAWVKVDLSVSSHFIDIIKLRTDLVKNPWRRLFPRAWRGVQKACTYLHEQIGPP